MSAITTYAAVLQTSAVGVARSYAKANDAANRIVRNSAVSSSMDRVSVSNEALRQAEHTQDPSEEGIVGPMVNLRVAKYSAAANLKVLSTADQLAKDTLALGGNKPDS